MISEAKNERPEDPRLDLSNSEVSLASSVSSHTSFPPDASSVISRYIARFRYAPPTSPSERDYGTPAEPEAFWWLDEARRRKKHPAEAPSSPAPASDLGGRPVRRHDDALLRFIEEEEEAAARHPHSLPQPIDISSVRGRALPSRAAAPPSPPKAFASPSSPRRDSRQQQEEEEEVDQDQDQEEDEDSLEARTQRLLRQCESVLAAYHRDNGRGPLRRSLDSTTSSGGDSEMSPSLRESVESNSTILSQSSEKEEEESEEEESVTLPTTSTIDPVLSPSSASYESSPPRPAPARISRSPIPPRPVKGVSAPVEDDESASFYLSASSSSGLLSLQSLASSVPTTASVEQSRISVESTSTIVHPDEPIFAEQHQQLEGDEKSGAEVGHRAEGVAETKSSPSPSQSPVADQKKSIVSVPAVSSAAETERAGGSVGVTTVPNAGQGDVPLCVNYELVAPYLDDELLNQLWLRLQVVNQQLEDLRMSQS